MKAFLALVGGVVLLSFVLGAVTGNQPLPTRANAHGVAVGPEWYTTLPADPTAATEAFLARIPAEVRARGDAFGATRYVTLPLRIAVLLGSIALIMFSGAAAGMRRIAQRVSPVVPLQDAVLAVQMLVALYLLNLPVETYAGFVRMRHAGFSQATYAQWLVDTTVSWATLAAFHVVGLVAVMALIRRRPGTWAAWATAVYVVLSATFVLIEPLYVEPLLNRMTSLDDGPRKQAILSLARANGVPATDVFVRDASRQSVLLDAHVSGFAGTARIVLDDNSIASASESEIKLVMAHEIGHYVLAHIPKAVVFDSLVMGVGIMLMAFSARRLVSRFGRRWQVAGLGDIGALPVIWGLFLLWGFLSIPATNGITRQQEIEADIFALNASQEPLAQGEWMIRDADTGQLDPSPIEELLFYHHPSPRSRIYAAMRWRAEQMGEPHGPTRVPEAGVAR